VGRPPAIPLEGLRRHESVTPSSGSADTSGMASPPQSIKRAGGAAHSAVAGSIVMAFAFFDGVFLGAPIAMLTAASGSSGHFDAIRAD
jgi:hypothetical protein